MMRPGSDHHNDMQHESPSDDALSARRMRRFVVRLLLVAVPLAALATAWWATRDAAPQATTGGHDHSTMAMAGDSARPVMLTSEQSRRIGVTFAPVLMGDVPRQIRTVGQVTLDETRVTTISSRVDGWVEKLYVDFTGSPVRQGEALFAIYSPALVSAQEELLLAHRLARDVAGGDSSSREGAADLVASARRRLAFWNVPEHEIARVESAGQVRRTLTFTSPANGVVIEKNVTKGQRVMSGDALYRVADLSTVWVEGDVYEQDLRAVRIGQPATAELDAYPGERWSGRIAYVYPTLSPETRTARVRVEIANPGQRLMPGMYATLHVTGAGQAGTLTVPRSAILVTGERQMVFLKRADGMLEPRLVEIGATSDDRREIVRGVALGDTVVRSATFLVDAESNLGTELGGMGDMPGMEFTMPPTSESESGRGPNGGHQGQHAPDTNAAQKMPDAHAEHSTPDAHAGHSAPDANDHGGVR